MSAEYDVAAVRACFPALSAGAAHFDGPGGSLTPTAVADAVHGTLVAPIANRGTVTAAEQYAEAVVQQARGAVADLLGAKPSGVVFGRSMTQLTLDLARTLARTWTAGDEVVVSRLDHDANVRPWVLAAERAGATVRWIDFDPDTAELGVEDVASQLTDRTRLVALTGASNLLGTMPDLSAVAAEVHRTPALFFVDAVHLTAHSSVDLAECGADVLACSPYKFFGPHCGVLAADPDLLEQLHPDKLLPASDAVPERFELGTLPYELLAGTTAAVDFIAGLAPGSAGQTGTAGQTEPAVQTEPARGGGGRRERVVAAMTAVEAHEARLLERLEAELAELAEVDVRSRAARRTPTLLLTLGDRSAADAYRYLAGRGVNAPAGSFYAYEPARRLGLPEGGLRVGLSPYTDDADVDRLLTGLSGFLAESPVKSLSS